jgi:hypothetical protein
MNSPTVKIEQLPPQYAVKKLYSYTANNIEYEGWAPSGTATSDAKWVIKKYVYDATPNLTTELWANVNTSGQPTATNIWDNRTLLTYA